MNLLAVDTATEKLSVALSRGDETFSFTADAGLRHSELVMDIIDTLMKKAALNPGDLSGVVCSGGPGSFTGLRIGFTLAKGLALSLGIPFAAIPTLDCMVRPFSYWPGVAVPVIDAKKAAFFCALSKNGNRLCPDVDATPAEIAKMIGIACGAIGRGQGAPAALSAGIRERCSNNTPLTPNPYPLLPILLVGPGAPLLHEKLVTLNPQHTDIIVANSWGDAVTLLEIAKETSVIEKGGTDPSAGPEYIRKSDAELT
jgi:tRNA threonylcarbamoyladenosine biosynthesis protein TsaB